MISTVYNPFNFLSYGGKKWTKNIITNMILARIMLKICANLIDYLKKIIFSEDFISHHKRSSKDFTRRRSLPFPTLIVFLINFIKGSIQDELDYYFKAIDSLDVAVRTVTSSAFCKARKKLKHQAFIELNQKLLHYFYKHFCFKTWCGFRVLGVDGSTIQLPNTQEVAEHFGVMHPAQGDPCPMARVSQLFDVLNKVTINALISPRGCGERNLAAHHMEHIDRTTLILLDRGYPAFWLFALILAQGAHFCARIAATWWHPVRKFLASGERETIITLSASATSLPYCREYDLPTTALTVRLVRIDLDNGETEVLITSLCDTECYPYHVFKDLYHKRWPVEEDYKAIKCRIEIENFSGKSVEAICQDFHAKIFSMNLTAVLVHPTRQVIDETNKNRKLFYQPNMTQALSKMKDSIVLLFQRNNPFDLIVKLFDLFIKTIEPIRPGRSYPRKKALKLKRYCFCYKPIR
jgi:hypothetical protein